MQTSRITKVTLSCVFFVAIGCSRSPDKLIAQLADSDPLVRRAAAKELANHREAVAVVVPALERVLADSDASVRLTAALAIQNIDAKNLSFRPVILESLQAGHAPMLIEVGRIGRDADWAVPTLAALLSHPQPQVRALSARALGEIGDSTESVLTSLRKRLHDENQSVRKAAEQALREIESRDSD